MMPMDSVGHDFGQDAMRMAYLGSVMSETSTGEILTAGGWICVEAF